MTDLAVIILTYKEQKHILRAIASVQEISCEIFIIDSYSTDRTIEMAQAAGARVFQNTFVNQAQQFAWGLQQVPISATWIMRLDADEVIEPDLVAEIKKKLPGLGRNVAGINLKRKHIFMGRWVRHGGRYPLVLLRIWRRGQGRIENRWMDEHMVVWGGRIITFEGGFSDHNLNNLTFFTEKHNKYATREAIEILNQKYGLFARDEDLSAETASFQAAQKRFLKERLYNRLPFWAGPLGYFIFRYVFQLGFLDGHPGLVYHFLQGFWYRFLVNAKVLEYEMELKSCMSNVERITALERMTGYRLGPTDG